ncbi:hypothetical protein BASA62_002635 [Batrachochytrium salamandrivorans]|nr:hypothetical protein BASA62_002635 [Batrachochytrium salamandrivorans]
MDLQLVSPRMPYHDRDPSHTAGSIDAPIPLLLLLPPAVRFSFIDAVDIATKLSLCLLLNKPENLPGITLLDHLDELQPLATEHLANNHGVHHATHLYFQRVTERVVEKPDKRSGSGPDLFLQQQSPVSMPRSLWAFCHDGLLLISVLAYSLVPSEHGVGTVFGDEMSGLVRGGAAVLKLDPFLLTCLLQLFQTFPSPCSSPTGSTTTQIGHSQLVSPKRFASVSRILATRLRRSCQGRFCFRPDGLHCNPTHLPQQYDRID